MKREHKLKHVQEKPSSVCCALAVVMLAHRAKFLRSSLLHLLTSISAFLYIPSVWTHIRQQGSVVASSAPVLLTVQTPLWCMHWKFWAGKLRKIKNTLQRRKLNKYSWRRSHISFLKIERLDTVIIALSVPPFIKSSFREKTSWSKPCFVYKYDLQAILQNTSATLFSFLNFPYWQNNFKKTANQQDTKRKLEFGLPWDILFTHMVLLLAEGHNPNCCLGLLALSFPALCKLSEGFRAYGVENTYWTVWIDCMSQAVRHSPPRLLCTSQSVLIQCCFASVSSVTPNVANPSSHFAPGNDPHCLLVLIVPSPCIFKINDLLVDIYFLTCF